MKKKTVFISAMIVLLLAGSAVQAQDKPIRIGLKFGIPNIAGLNGEYVTPLLGGRLAASADFSYFGINVQDAKLSFYYFELGPNFYFMKPGKGLYGNVSYGRMGVNLSYDDILSEIDPLLSGGSGEVTLGVNLFNFKIGAKLGNSFYFRPEIGYALASVADNLSVSVTFPDGSTETQDQAVPGLIGGGVVFNLGFGVAF